MPHEYTNRLMRLGLQTHQNNIRSAHTFSQFSHFSNLRKYTKRDKECEEYTTEQGDMGNLRREWELEHLEV